MRTTKKLYQWDTDQKLIDCVGKYVDYPIGDEVYRIEVIDKECIIPDELLQVSGTVKVYECMEYGTVKAFAFYINPRPMPPDYVFTPTQRLTFEGLVKKVDETIEDLQKRADSGEFNGSDYVITESDYDAIAAKTAGKLQPTIGELARTLETEKMDREKADISLQKDISGKLSEPVEGIAVGKYFRVAQIDENGHAVLEAVDAKTIGVQDVQVNGDSIVTDGVAYIPSATNSISGVIIGNKSITSSNFLVSSGSPYCAKRMASDFYEQNDFAFVSNGTLRNVLSAPSLMPTLSVEEQAAAQERLGVTDEFNSINTSVGELKGNLDELYHIEIGKNKLNPNELEVGLLKSDGTIGANTLYKTTGFIAVTEGDIVTASYYDSSNGTNPIANMRYVMPYDSDKAHGTLVTTQATTYTVPSGVSYIKASFNASNYASGTRIPQIELTNDGIFTSFEEYKETKTINDDVDIPEVRIARGNYQNLNDRLNDIDSRLTVEDESTVNWNLIDMTKTVDGFLQSSGDPSGNNPPTSSSSFFTTDFISAKKGDRFVCSTKTSTSQTVANVNYFAEYDADKNFISGTYSSPKNSVVNVTNENTAYIRASIRCGTYGFDIKLEKNKFGLPTTYEVYNKLKNLVQPKHVFLPKYIYCAVGRTVEIYNSQVCLESEKYHFQWVCANGIAMGRKFSITATSNMASTRTDSAVSVGQHRLWLNIYDDDNNLVWQGASIICVADGISSEKTIVPIGDSLTNQKPWLSELMNLSANISLVGTRTFNLSDADGNTRNGFHEGRSGWSAIRYTEVGDTNPSDASFTYANPFYNGNTFSMSYYVQNSLNGTIPNAVQIYLGTNDVASGVDVAVTNIKALVDSIKTDYDDMPIMVVNTIYRSRQDGYASIGTDGYAGVSGAKAYQFDEDIKIIELAKDLTLALLDVENVYVIPLYASHDTDYNFGSNEVKANPRATQNVTIPLESVHPQAQGYYQMADVMYSAYCVVLN